MALYKQPSRQKSFLPSRKVRYILVFICIVGLLVGFFPKLKSLWQESKTNRANIAVLQNSPDRDTDNDGVPDWQEILVNLDPRLPDTDGDGVGDQKAFEDRRLSAENANLDTSVFEHSNTTDKLGLILAEAIANLPTTATEEDLKTVLTENIGAYIASKKALYAIYTKNSLVLSGNSADEMKAYALVVTETLRSNEINIVQILSDAKTGLQTSSTQKELSLHKEKLDALIEALNSIIVPSQAVDVHLAFQNSIAIASGTISEILENPTDPSERAALAILLQNTVASGVESYNTLQHYISLATK